MSGRLPNFQPGRPISAADLRTLVDELRMLRTEVDRLKGLLGSRMATPTIERGVVISRTGGGAPGAAVEMGTVTYTVRPLGAGPESDIAGREPDFGRLVDPAASDAMIVAAEPGDAALIVRMPDGTGKYDSLIFVQEKIAAEPCDGGA